MNDVCSCPGSVYVLLALGSLGVFGIVFNIIISFRMLVFLTLYLGWNLLSSTNSGAFGLAC